MSKKQNPTLTIKKTSGTLATFKLPEPQVPLMITEKEAAILLGWRAACYASGSDAKDRALDFEQGTRYRVQQEEIDRSEWELEARLLQFEGGVFVQMGRTYRPKSVNSFGV